MTRLLMLFVLAVPRLSSAGGFAVGAQSAEGLGLAGAVSAKPELWSAGFYNPSTALDHQGTSGYAGSLLVDASFDVEDPDGGAPQSNRRSPTLIPHLFASYGDGALGVVLFTGVPFGSGIAYSAGWRGRHEVTDIALRAVAVNPNVVYRPDPRISFAAGVQYVRSTIEYRSRIELASDEAGVHLGGAANGIGLTASITYRPIAQLGIAATYRSRTRLEIGGSADFQDVPMAFGATLVDQGIKSTLVLPDRVTLGAHWQATPELGVSADLEYMAWSSFETLEFDFEDDELDQRVPRNWHDTVAVRLGGEYQLPRGFRARSGLVYDPDVSPTDTLSPTTPDADRYGLALGGSYRHDALTVDVGYMYLAYASRSSTGDAFPATYDGRAHVAALTAGYRWR